jgi:enamine deaminase RidA (YjgF/YER057c/UK114 family)
VTAVLHINPESLPTNPAFSQVVRVPAGHDMIYVGGQNGVSVDGQLVGPGMAEQAEQAMANLRACLEAAGGQLTDVVEWRVLCVQGAPLREGFAAFAVWPRDAAPPAITVAMVAGLAVPGALAEIAATAAVAPR